MLNIAFFEFCMSTCEKYTGLGVPEISYSKSLSSTTG
jgi:hypothetical protein